MQAGFPGNLPQSILAAPARPVKTLEKRAPMDVGEAESPKARVVELRAVALVKGEFVLREKLREAAHPPIPGDFRGDGSENDGKMRLVAPNDRPLNPEAGGRREGPVEENGDLFGDREAKERPTQGESDRLDDAQPVNPPRPREGNGEGEAAGVALGPHEAEPLFPLPRPKFLRIADAPEEREIGAEGEIDRGDGNGSRERPAARLVHSDNGENAPESGAHTPVV